MCMEILLVLTISKFEYILRANIIIDFVMVCLARNPIEFKYNSLISNFPYLQNKFIEYNGLENKYYINDIIIQFILKENIELCQQLPVLD